jgi:hypothetical protein
MSASGRHFDTPGKAEGQRAWTLSVQSESDYNWETEKWSIPVNAALAKLVYFGKLPVSLQAGVGYWLESPATGPEG